MKKQNDSQTIKKAVGRPMLEWVGKKPLENVEYYPAQEKEVYGKKDSLDFNKLFWGDNLQVLSHLLKEYRGKVDLVYIDPPFDSKADYIKKVKIKGEKVEGVQEGLLEEKQYTDIWENDEYLQFMYERLLIVKELLSDSGSMYLHCDWHKSHHLRCLLDEVFGEDNFVNEIVWCNTGPTNQENNYPRKHQVIYFYTKNKKYTFNTDKARVEYKKSNKSTGKTALAGKADDKALEFLDQQGKVVEDWWVDIADIGKVHGEDIGYPTQKTEALLTRILNVGSNSGDLVMDCFCGSGTTLAVAQKLGRKWIGCDINLGAIQTTTKRLNQIVEKQIKDEQKLIKDKFDGSLGFKILNVNDYDIFKNEIEAKEIIMEMYGVEPLKRGYFDGSLDNNFVKVMPMNRVLNKLDIKTIIKSIQDDVDSFTVKPTSKTGESTYEEGVVVICSGAEVDTNDFIKKENNTGVKIEIRDILNDKKNLIFKQKPEAKVETTVSDSKVVVKIVEFYSPILMRKLQIENEKIIDSKAKVIVDDYKQIVDSVAIDIDYDGELFNAEIMDIPTKKETIKSVYSHKYEKKGEYSIAIKIVDVLGEEYFETIKIKV